MYKTNTFVLVSVQTQSFANFLLNEDIFLAGWQPDNITIHTHTPTHALVSGIMSDIACFRRENRGFLFCFLWNYSFYRALPVFVNLFLASCKLNFTFLSPPHRLTQATFPTHNHRHQLTTIAGSWQRSVTTAKFRYLSQIAALLYLNIRQVGLTKKLQSLLLIPSPYKSCRHFLFFLELQALYFSVAIILQDIHLNISTTKWNIHCY